MTSVLYRRVVASDVPALARLRGEGEVGWASEERMRRYLSGERHPQPALLLPRGMRVATERGAPIGYKEALLPSLFSEGPMG
jgi:hypothetical protein